jgi:1-aminocyclopropane-1-carboxylate deaminase/D-cysteine desulfhydrase-like pyridoxal-dependent ACC family enzyme
MNGKINLQIPSPIHALKDELFKEKKVNVFIKRDDLIHHEISGNKWRKLKYNIEEANNKTILTFGGAYSNHIAASAAACNYYSINCIGIIRGERPHKLNNTLAFAIENGMRLEFISREKYRNKNTPKFLEELNLKYNQPYIIPEGGANENGVRGCSEVIQEIDEKFDFIISAIGTGTTLAGLSLGLNKKQKAIGISVLKGAQYLDLEIKQMLQNYPDNNAGSNHSIKHKYHFGGYAKINSELIDFMNSFYLKHSIKTDPIYSGKSLFALYDMIKNDEFPENSTIVFYHCGGLQGIKGIEDRYKVKLF